MKKKSHTQELLEAIMVTHKCDLPEALRIYKQKYEQDDELSPDRVKALQNANPQRA